MGPWALNAQGGGEGEGGASGAQLTQAEAELPGGEEACAGLIQAFENGL